MMKRFKIYLFAAVMGLVACNSEEDNAPMPDAALEIRGIHATIDTDEARALTRADEESTQKTTKIGRSEFAAGETIVFTSIKRTTSPLDGFTYSNISYDLTDKLNWKRTEGNLPEKIYWTDATSPHTFIGYSLPSQTYNWTDNNDNTFSGELGYSQKEEVSYTTNNLIDYHTTGNEALKKEDLLLNYNTKTVAETGGLSTKVTFTHALSNVCVVVNIKNFASSAGAVDTQVGVSNMVLANQPTKYRWGIHSRAVKTLDFNDAQTTQTTKNLKLWCPEPAGEGTGQSKTFKFYGITTPQDTTFHGINGNDKKLAFSFTVTYPDPMKPTETLTKTYSGEFTKLVNFNAGMCTTLNISLNHKDEQMFTGVTYTNWNYVETPDLGKLRKKSTFMDMTTQEEGNVKVHTDAVTVDDATWLYQDGNDVKDIYGHDGTSAQKAYVIKSAQQLLALAKEVNSDYRFEGKFIRLEADITMQKSAKDSTYIWNGIGDDSHLFEGTFLGGDRFINRLKGSPLFAKLGENAHVEQLQITAIGDITGGGALADTNEGVIAACRVIDDVNTTGGAGGALVGTNSGTIYASYYTGTNETLLVGENVENKGTTIGCYVANDIPSLHDVGTIVNTKNVELSAWYENNDFTEYYFHYSAGNYPTVSTVKPENP